MSQSHLPQRPPIALSVDEDALRGVFQTILQESAASVDWPEGRLTLSEAEAALACGVGRHVLRDARLAGHLAHRRINRRVFYARQDLLEYLERVRVESAVAPGCREGR